MTDKQTDRELKLLDKKGGMYFIAPNRPKKSKLPTDHPSDRLSIQLGLITIQRALRPLQLAPRPVWLSPILLPLTLKPLAGSQTSFYRTSYPTGTTSSLRPLQLALSSIRLALRPPPTGPKIHLTGLQTPLIDLQTP